MPIVQIPQTLGTGVSITSGAGSPEGIVTAGVGAVYLQTNGNGIPWFKVSGIGSTGWQQEAGHNVMTYAAGATINDGIVDATAAIQAAVDAALLSGFPVYLPKGEYKITAPIRIFTFTGGAFTSYGRLTMYGRTFGDATAGKSARIVPTFNDVPAIIIQNARKVRLVDIAILGKNDFSSSVTIANNFSYLMTNSNYVINGCRDSRYSPYAGIAVDPFGTSVPADGGYPGFSSFYVASAQGSSNLEFERVAITGFVVGVMMSPSGTVAQDDLVVFKNCDINYCKVGVAIGQNQSRIVNWYGGSNAWHLYGFDGNTYGARTGYAPHIFGCNMAGKYLFNVYHQAGAAQDITGVHAEAFASIGFLGSYPGSGTVRHPFSFRGCELNFYDFGGIFADHQLATWAPVDFTACQISAPGITFKFPLRFFHDTSGTSQISFRSTYIGDTNAILGEMFLAPTTGSGAAGDGPSGIFFDGCTLGEGGTRGPTSGPGPLSHRIVEQSASLIDRATVPLGAIIKYNSATNPGQFLMVGNAQDSVSLGTVTVTTGANGTASFTAADATILEIGDLIYSYTAMTLENHLGAAAFTSNQECLGIVSNVAGSVITITGWPQSLVTGSYALRLQWWNRFHQASTGDTHTNTTVDNVTNPTSWKIGNRIKGTGIPAGAYITNVVGSTLTISKAATGTSAGVRLYDADIYSFTGTAV